MIKIETQITRNLIIIPLLSDGNFDYLIITKSIYAPSVILENEFKYSGRVIYDRLLHNGNGSDRFVAHLIENNSIRSTENVFVTRNSIYRKLSSQLLRNEENLIKNSILNNKQKETLLRGEIL